MYDTLEFLQTILPPLPTNSIIPTMTDGAYFAVALHKDKKPRVITDPSCTLRGIVELCESYSQRGYNAYMALASYADPTAGRKVANAMQCRAVWADIDVGKANTKYTTIEAALADLITFRKLTGFIPTYVVQSGLGLHVYWAFKECINIPVWKQLARYFHAICTDAQLGIDPPRAEDAASILRLPGTLHQSSGRPVQILAKGPVYSAIDFVKQMKAVCPHIAPAAPAPAPAPAPVKAPNVVASDAILRLAGMAPQEPTADAYKIARNCPAMLTMGYRGYQQWFLGLTVCKSCKDGLKAAHALSAMCPERYDAAAVDRIYASASDGMPARCVTFEGAAPDMCAQCKWRGLLTSPIELDRRVQDEPVTSGSNAPSEPVTGGNTGPVEPVKPVQGGTVAPLDPVLKDEDTLIPIKNPNYIIDNRGIIKVTREMDEVTGEWHNSLILMTDVQMYFKRSELYMSENGQPQRTHVFELIYPSGLHAEARYVIADHSRNVTILTWLQQHNIFPKSPAVTAKMFGDFMNAYLESIVNTKAAKEVPTRDRFGWTKYETKDKPPLPCFVIGQRGVTPEGLKPVKIHGKLSALADLVFNSKGSLEEWKKVPRLYRILDQKAGQFAMCLSFAAPLMRFVLSEARNGLFSLYGQSGRGKSELLRNVASVWGDPMQSFFDRRASVTARCLKLSKWNNIPATMDEVTDVSDEDMYSLAYTLINGSDKEKSASSGAELLTQGNWSTITLTTANRSFKEAISRRAGDSDATLLRVVEFDCDFQAVTDPVGRAVLDTVMTLSRSNFGLAGQEFLYQLLQRGERILTLPQTITHWINQHAFRQEERYISHMVAMALQAGRWAVEFGLLDYDMDALEQWVLDYLVPTNRRTTHDLSLDPVDALTAYLTDRQLNTLVVDCAKRMPSYHGSGKIMAAPDKYILYRPTKTCRVRFERREPTLYIYMADFKAWCADNNLSAAKLVAALAAVGIRMGQSRIPLWRSVPWTSSPIARCWKLEEPALEKLGYSFDYTQEENDDE